MIVNCNEDDDFTHLAISFNNISINSTCPLHRDMERLLFPPQLMLPKLSAQISSFVQFRFVFD